MEKRSAPYPAPRCSREKADFPANEERLALIEGCTHRGAPCRGIRGVLRRYTRRTLTESGGNRAPPLGGRRWCSGELQYPGLKHVGSRPSVCIESGAPRSAPHEYLNWILKAQNHRTNEPSPRCRDLDERVGDATNFEGSRRIK